MSDLRVEAEGDRTIRITRSFGAPRERVFEAWTRPELLQRWLFGPDGWEFVLCEVDLRVGGRYRYAWRNGGRDGETKTMTLGGEFREIDAARRLVTTEAFEEYAEFGEAVSTLVLTEENGRTVATQTVVYPSREARDAMLATDMEAGLARGYERLDDLLSSEAVAAEVGP